MFRSDNAYSRLVTFLKVLLPVLALAVLSSLFLFSKPREALQGVGSTDSRILRMAREIGIGKPRFSGKTVNGSSIYMTASKIRRDPQAEGVIDALNVQARLEGAGDLVVTARAGKGVLNQNTMMADLSGGVVIDTSNGYQAVTAGLTVSLNQTHAVSHGQVTATGPLGRIEAGQMELYEKPGQDGAAHVLVFNKGVKLVYQTQNNMNLRQ